MPRSGALAGLSLDVVRFIQLVETDSGTAEADDYPKVFRNHEDLQTRGGGTC